MVWKNLGLAQGSVTGLAKELPYRDRRLAILNEFNRVSRRWVVLSLYIQTPLHLLHRRIVNLSSRITMLSRGELREEAREAGLQLVRMVSVLPGLHAQRICLFTSDQAA